MYEVIAKYINADVFGGDPDNETMIRTMYKGAAIREATRTKSLSSYTDIKILKNGKVLKSVKF